MVLNELYRDICQVFCDTDSKGTVNRIKVVIHALLFCCLIGLVIIVLFGLLSASHSNGFSIAGVGLLLAGGIFILGWLLGFLFGIPRTELGFAHKEKTENDLPQYTPNTNLEQISDWLTKILVGVGLTQLIQLPTALQDYAGKLAPSLGGSPSGGVFSVAILIFFSVDGFLVGFLWTRRYYANELQESDFALHNREDLERQHKADLEALQAAGQILNPQPGHPVPLLDEFYKKLTAAKEEIKEAIYSMASNQQFRNESGEAFERTEPIFRGLIKCDPKISKYHENLGFVLSGKLPPEWEEAEKEFTTAIQYRRSQDPPYYYDEAFRAKSRIHRDEDFKKIPPVPCSDSSLKESIFKDLDVAKLQYEVLNNIKGEKEVMEWTKLNNYDWDDYKYLSKDEYEDYDA
jgi:hypothetical protein